MNLDLANETVFYIKIKDGHSFRSMLAMVKGETNRIIMKFSKKTIEFDYTKSEGINVGYRIELSTDNFEEYSFEPRQKDFHNDQCIIGIDVAEFHNATKGIGTRDSIIFYRKYSDDNDPKISIIHVKSSAKDMNDPIVLYSKIMTPSIIPKPIKDIDANMTPNIKIQPKSFSDICNFINTTNCCYLGIDGFENGAVMKGIHSIDSYKFIKPYGFTCSSNKNFSITEIESMVDTEEYNRKLLTKTKIPKKIVKSISKFNNISNSKENGYVKFYFIPEKYIVIKGEISNFGICSVFISDIVGKE